jgi:hypothetical protein
MSIIKEKLTAAIEAKNNDIKSFTWKLPKDKETKEQKEILMINATDEQLQEFYNQCKSMLYNDSPTKPGRYVLLDIIKEQRSKCNVELFLRDLESGKLTSDGKRYPRFLYCQDFRSFMDLNKESFPNNKLNEISISAFTNGLPREYSRISIADVFNGCLNQLGDINTKAITYNFIISMGINLTKAERKELKKEVTDSKHIPELIKEKLNIPAHVILNILPTGLNFKELRAMINLKSKELQSKNYRDLTTDQLVTLRNKVLFRLENEVKFHIEQWEELMRKLRLVAESRGLTLS